MTSGTLMTSIAVSFHHNIQYDLQEVIFWKTDYCSKGKRKKQRHWPPVWSHWWGRNEAIELFTQASNIEIPLSLWEAIKNNGWSFIRSDIILFFICTVRSCQALWLGVLFCPHVMWISCVFLIWLCTLKTTNFWKMWKAKLTSPQQSITSVSAGRIMRRWLIFNMRSSNSDGFFSQQH